MNLQNVVLTGASGMFGRHCLEEMHKIGCSGFACSRRRPNYLPPGWLWQQIDFAKEVSPDSLNEFFPDAEAVIHAAAQIPNSREVEIEAMFRTNVAASMQIASWAHRKKIPLAFISSSSVYKDTTKVGLVETDDCSSGSFGGFYAYSKRMAEQALLFFAQQGSTVAILRPSAMYAAGQDSDFLLQRFLSSLLNEGRLVLTPPFEDSFHFVHASDVARAAIQALKKGKSGIFNISYPQSYTVEEIAEICFRTTKNGKILRSEGKASREACARFHLNVRKAACELDFQAAIDLERGIEELYRVDFKKQRKGRDEV